MLTVEVGDKSEEKDCRERLGEGRGDGRPNRREVECGERQAELK